MAGRQEVRGQSAGSMAAIMNHQRHRYIIDQLNAEQGVRVSVVAKALNVSEATIRRDLQELERQGLLRCVHGGAAPLNESTILPLAVRKTMNKEQKDRIAKRAAELLRGLKTVFLGGGTTMLAVADRLAAQRPELCVTDMIDVAVLLTQRRRGGVVLLGGHVDPELRTVTGAWTVEQIRDFRFDAAVTSTNAIHPVSGFLDHDEFAFHHRRAVAEVAERYIIVADHSKFGRKSRLRTFPLATVTDIVTDQMPGSNYVEALERAGVSLHLADDDGT